MKKQQDLFRPSRADVANSYSSTKNLEQKRNISESLPEKLSHARLLNLANQQTKIVSGIDTVIINAQPGVVVRTNDFDLASWKLNCNSVNQSELDSLSDTTFIQHRTDAIQTSFYGNNRLKTQFNVRKVLGFSLEQPVNKADFDNALSHVIDNHLRRIGFYVDDFKHVHFARIDPCFDVYSNIPSRPIREVLKNASRFNGSEKKEPTIYQNTVYAGIKSLEWRIYDKALKAKLSSPCTRIEAEVKGKYNQRIFGCHRLSDWHKFDYAGIFDRFEKDFPLLAQPMNFSVPAYTDMKATEHTWNARLKAVLEMGGSTFSDKVENYLSGMKGVTRPTKSRWRKRLMSYSGLTCLQTDIPAESIRTQVNLANLKQPLVEAFNEING
jgi:hypothetical protein